MQPCSIEKPQSPLRRQRFTLILAYSTAICISFTIYFAYNSSMERPLSTCLIFERPERTILTLNIASQITVFLLGELTISVLEVIRWAFACSASGTSAYTFLALSRATNIIGVFFLLQVKGRTRQKLERDGHRLWGSQRYLHQNCHD